jgi:hypothetical protein
VNISHGQNPAWGPLFVMDYYAISFDAQSDVTMTQAQFIQTVLMDEDSMELNATEAEEK